MSQSDHSNWQHSGKNRWVAVILAYFLPFGIHQIYLGQYKKAVYIGLLCFIAIGIFIAWGQGIHYLIMGEEEFHRRLTMENKEFNEWKEQSKESEVDDFTVD